MTPLMLSFLKELGQPMQSSRQAAELYNLPETNTPIPVVPVITSFAAFLTPGMGKTEEDSRKIDELFKSERAPISIIFNESGFELNIEKDEKPETYVLVISPAFQPGLYSVSLVQSPNDYMSTFSQLQVMSPKSIAFHISVALENMLPSIHKIITPSISKKRNELIKSLCADEKVPELAAISTGVFQKK